MTRTRPRVSQTGNPLMASSTDIHGFRLLEIPQLFFILRLLA